MTIGERIKTRRIELGLSVDELAKRLGKNRATVYRYENGDIKDMPTPVLEPLAKVLETTPAELMGWIDETVYVPKSEYDTLYDTIQESLKGITENIRPIATQTLPVLGEIACGEPKFMDEQYEVYTSAGASMKADFILIAKGDSMTGARIYDGDLVFVRQQPEVENGEIAVVCIDDEATLKRFYKYDNLIVLRPENPDYEEMQYGPDSDPYSGCDRCQSDRRRSSLGLYTDRYDGSETDCPV